MKKEINLGIAFVTGRSNACRIINSYYQDMLEQVARCNKKVNITIYILFDTEYQKSKREEFYDIKPEVYKDIEVKYITPEDINEEIKKLEVRRDLKEEDLNLFLGHGHARGRNTVMYFALQDNMNYLLFWDDDEYPVAVSKENGKNVWIKQDNILKHLEYINKEKADVTIGYHCGYISPIPYMDGQFTEEDLKEFIEVISNDIISWESIREKMKNHNGVTYANLDLATGNGVYEIQTDGIGKWVAGSTLCLNLDNIEKIPAFYNPPNARGEDTFFSTSLENSKTIKIPVYHFHDGFLKYTEIMDGIYPKSLRKINVKEENIESRFLKATLGWIKYKPLLLYIKDKKTYKNEIKIMVEKLKKLIPKFNDIFNDNSFDELLTVLEQYDKNVEKHYNDYIKTNEIWNTLKRKID